jgi:hypothetical protein
MAHTYEYAILTAIPNPRRGERVNIGIVVFRPEQVDVRFRQATYKLRAVTGDNWEARMESAASCFKELFDGKKLPAEMLEEFDMLEPLMKPSQAGWLSANTSEEYEERVEQILKSLVSLPPRERHEAKSRINTEIAVSFKRLNLLAKEDETIEDKKIVRNFSIDSREGLVADFALKNGKFHVTSTLDLRKHSANLGDAALKSIVLDKALKQYGTQAKRIGVYAVDRDMLDNFRRHIDLLGDYADELYDWLDRDNRLKFHRNLSEALGRDVGDLI